MKNSAHASAQTGRRAQIALLSPIAFALSAMTFSAAAEPFSLDEAIAAPAWLTISGSQRTRYESLGGQFRAGGAGGDQLLSLRNTLKAEAKFDNIRIVGEAWDVRVFLADDGSPVGTGEANALEPVQAYVAARFDGLFGEGSQTDITGGRFLHDVGSTRLIGFNKFRMTTNSFTGVDFDTTFASGDRLKTFYALPQRRRPANRSDRIENKIDFDDESFDQRLWGALYNRRDIGGGVSGEIFAFRLSERDDDDFNSANRRITTVGGRMYRAARAGAADGEIEGGYQFGKRRATAAPTDLTDLDVSASYLHADAGYTFATGWKPRVAFEFDYASGDENPADSNFNRFDRLFGVLRFDFGPTGIYGMLDRGNIVSPGASVRLAPSKRIDAMAFYRAVWLDEPSDFFGRTGLRDSSGVSGSYAGSQVEARLRYWLAPKNVRLEVGSAYFGAGAYADRVPGATGEGDTAYFYSDIEFSF